MQDKEPEVKESKLTELKSWLKNDACKPALKEGYSAKTGLRPLPSRWVIEFKEKLGAVVVSTVVCEGVR